MKPDNEAEDVTCNSAYHPFPEPQTIPAGWDLSGIMSISQKDVSEEDSTKAISTKGIQVDL